MAPKIIHINNLDEAKAEMKKINVNPAGTEIMALKAVFRLVKFEQVDPKAANIVKQEMLSRGGDVAVSETVGMFEAQKTDLLIMGTLAQYVRLIRKLKKQPFSECLGIAEELQRLLFGDLDVDAACVW